MPTRDEFTLRFRGRMLVFLAEAWSCRSMQPSQLGLVMDNHAKQLRDLLHEMYDSLTPDAAPTHTAAPANGKAVKTTAAV